MKVLGRFGGFRALGFKLYGSSLYIYIYIYFFFFFGGGIAVKDVAFRA